MRIIINLKIFIILIIFVITRQIKIYTLLMLFAFIHEMGHLFTGLLMGLKMDNIRIAPFGFSIAFKPEAEDKKLPIKRLLIALAGPITNVIIAIITYIYFKFNINANTVFIENVIYANILLFIFNMLPIYPLDGGRVIKEIINMTIGTKESFKYMQTISYATTIVLTMMASIGVLIFKNIAIPIAIIYLWIIVIKENSFIRN